MPESAPQATVYIEITHKRLFSSTNQSAADWASKHSGEQWADIGETVRHQIRRLVVQAFEKKTPFSELIEGIRRAGDFSETHATMIASTEVQDAQVRSQFEAWKNSGLVKKVKWLAVGHDPCPVCTANQGHIRALGEPFPNGAVCPTAHPGCSCILTATEFAE